MGDGGGLDGGGLDGIEIEPFGSVLGLGAVAAEAVNAQSESATPEVRARRDFMFSLDYTSRAVAR